MSLEDILLSARKDSVDRRITVGHCIMIYESETYVCICWFGLRLKNRGMCFRRHAFSAPQRIFFSFFFVRLLLCDSVLKKHISRLFDLIPYSNQLVFVPRFVQNTGLLRCPFFHIHNKSRGSKHILTPIAAMRVDVITVGTPRQISLCMWAMCIGLFICCGPQTVPRLYHLLLIGAIGNT